MPPETFLNSSDESDTSVEVSAEDLSPQEAKQRLKEIMKEAKLAPIQAEFSRIPLYLLTGGSLMYFVAELALRKSFITGVRRPTLFKWGSFSLGALGALQVAFWRMRRMYSQVDPDGSLQAKLRTLFERSRQ